MPVSKIGTGRYWTDGANRNGGDAGSVAIGAQFFDIQGDPTSATAGPDVLNGTGADDTIDGLAGDDVIHGLGGNDTLIGGADNDSLFGDDGNDTLTGGTGTDIMTGGIGNDVFSVDVAGDQVLEAVGEGNDTVNASVSYTLAAGVEVETLQTNDIFSIAFINLTGNEFGQRIIGNSGQNILDGGGGADILDGLSGGDTYLVDADDIIVEAFGSPGDDIVAARTSYVLNAGADVRYLVTIDSFSTAPINLTGNGFQWIVGNAGNNILDFGSTLDGGAGDDTLIVRTTNNRIFEAVGGGNDRVVAMVSGYNLTAGAEVETLEAFDRSNTTTVTALTGNEFGQTIIGTEASGFMDGRGGVDTLIGLGGNDTYVVDNAGDVVVEAVGGGSDWVRSSVSYALAAGLEVEKLSTDSSINTAPIGLTGNEFAQTITGNAGNNFLAGGGGTDTLDGGAGNDVIIVDADDIVIEAGGGFGGNDLVAALTSYALTAGAEVETLSTTYAGGLAAIGLTGNSFSQMIIGNAGNNFLDGNWGADTLNGGGGDDVIIVDWDDKVIEAVGGGNDLVAALSNFALNAGAEVETLSTTNSFANGAIGLTGNEFGQTIIGNAGANFLAGGGGADILNGGAGNDTIIVDSDDLVVEANGGGNDLVAALTSYTLNAGAEVETLMTSYSGGIGAINLTGNEFGQTIIGNAGANTLQGLGGADSFAFTTALGGGNVDTIVDFIHNTDKIALDDAIFGAGIGTPGAFNANAFVTGTAAGDADDRIIYNSATGQLFYDADGVGGIAAVQFATLQGAPTLTASDFMVI